MINAPSEMRCSEIPETAMTTNVIASTSGIAIATTRPARKPKADEADRKDDDDRLEQRSVKPETACLDDDRLIGDPMDSDADRQIGDDLGHLLLQRLAEFSRLAPDFMPIASAIAG